MIQNRISFENAKADTNDTDQRLKCGIFIE